MNRRTDIAFTDAFTTAHPEVYDRYAARRITALHEAAHAVAALLVGHSVRYVTLRPRDPRVGGCCRTYRTARALHRDGLWETDGVVIAAGMVAEHAQIILSGQQPSPGDRHYIAWGGRIDLHDLRDLCRYVLAQRDDDAGSHWAKPPLPAEWTVSEAAAHLWCQAARLLGGAWGAVEYVALGLYDASRAPTGRQIREWIAQAPRCDIDLDTTWWIPHHSRLRWNA